jgi:hypothetical protein
MKRILLVVFLAAFTAPATVLAQSACAMPEVRGLAVGMTEPQLRQHLPSFVMPKPNAYGYAELREDYTLERGSYESTRDETTVSPPDVLTGFDAKGLATLEVAFLDGKIVTLIFEYKPTTEWRDVTEFVQTISGPLKLPAPGVWTRVDPATLRLACGENVIRASVIMRGGSKIVIGRVGIAAEVEKRKRLEQERARQSFKP